MAFFIPPLLAKLDHVMRQAWNAAGWEYDRLVIRQTWGYDRHGGSGLDILRYEVAAPLAVCEDLPRG